MQEYKVEPFVGVGPVRLGMTRPDSRRAMGVMPSTFKKAPSSVMLTDAYHDASFQVYFGPDDRVEFIELSTGGPFLATYKGSDVFGTPADELVSAIAKDCPFDPDLRDLGYSYIFPGIQLSLWRPALPRDTGGQAGRMFSTIGIGNQGYYDEYLAKQKKKRHAR